MNVEELKVIEKHIHEIYVEWHGCALKKGETRKNQKVGQLCDNCNFMIIKTVSQIYKEAIEQNHAVVDAYLSSLHTKYPTGKQLWI